MLEEFSISRDLASLRLHIWGFLLPSISCAPNSIILALWRQVDCVEIALIRSRDERPSSGTPVQSINV
jgi:hypothetical protein